ncbi:MAG TPA: signal peptidase I [Clostridia bacterium]|nr:signal peptidase I [Clostridia bacterium]
MSDINIQPDGSAAPQGYSLKNDVFEWMEAIVFSLSFVVLLFTFVFRIVGVDGTSMLNTLQNGDRVVISDINYTPKRGDIIVLSTKAVEKPIIKRVIATEGQRIDIDYVTHTVTVDGKALSEPYIAEPTVFQGQNPVSLPATVPKGHVFVMGDNRNYSLDSRSSSIGMIDDRYILGRAVFRIFPFSGFGFLK